MYLMYLLDVYMCVSLLLCMCVFMYLCLCMINVNTPIEHQQNSYIYFIYTHTYIHPHKIHNNTYYGFHTYTYPQSSIQRVDAHTTSTYIRSIAYGCSVMQSAELGENAVAYGDTDISLGVTFAIRNNLRYPRVLSCLRSCLFW